jgi:prepilin-type N-terminal cleavage/methylation domain-containing protein
MKTRSRQTGFTLLELLVVLGIILILISILIPTVSKVRRSAQTAGVKAEIQNISGAIERFYQDQHQYPGPLPNSQIYTVTRGGTAPVITAVSGPALTASNITQSENLVLGLLGGLTVNSTGQQVYDPSMVGQGMVSKATGGIKKFAPYMSRDPKILSTGQYSDGAGAADDTVIPEFLDSYPNQLPILYLRANTGASGVVSIAGKNVDGNNQMTQYDLCDILAYTLGKDPSKTSIGEGKSINPKEYVNFSPAPSSGFLPHGLRTVNSKATLVKGAAGYQYPYDAFPYLVSPSVAPSDPNNPNATGTPRSKDTYILISAGPDRVYGTADDVCSFGSVTE